MPEMLPAPRKTAVAAKATNAINTCTRSDPDPGHRTTGRLLDCHFSCIVFAAPCVSVLRCALLRATGEPNNIGPAIVAKAFILLGLGKWPGGWEKGCQAVYEIGVSTGATCEAQSVPGVGNDALCDRSRQQVRDVWESLSHNGPDPLRSRSVTTPRAQKYMAGETA